MLRLRFTCVFVTATVLAACASVNVQKIGSDGAPVGPAGVRFNRPRPYVNVHEPFVVGARAYLVNGQVTPDGKFLLITSATDNLDGALRTALGSTIEVSRVLLTTPGALEAAPPGVVQSGDDTPTLPPIPPPGDVATPAPTPAEPPAEEPQRPPAPPAERTGQAQFKIVNDNNAFATQPMRRYMDLVFLPDFEEEYVVQVESRIGNASAALDLGQGWSLQGLDARIDNDSITRRLFALYDESIKIALQLGRTALGVPGLPGGVQSGADTTTAAEKLPAGTNVSIKVTLVRMVAPGLYPVLKPAEGLYVNNNMATLKTLFPDLDRRLLIPVYPMTNIAFNTYEVIVLEAAIPAGDSPTRLHQYIDINGGGDGSTSGGGGLGGQPASRGVVDLTNDVKRQAIEGQIEASLPPTGVSPPLKATIAPKSATTGEITFKNTGTLTPAQLKKAVDDVASANGLTLTVR